MSAILNFLFPGEPRDSRSSWLLLAARVVFGLLLMSHGIAKLQNFEALSATFPDPLGLGSRTSLVLAIFAEMVCALGFRAKWAEVDALCEKAEDYYILGDCKNVGQIYQAMNDGYYAAMSI